MKFASTDYTLDDFQREIDTLLATQEHEQRQRKIKQQGLARLEQSERQATDALAEMHRSLEASEQEVAVLKSRREQAEIESQTLEMSNSAAVQQRGTESVGRSLNRLRNEVGRIEAENKAKREVAPVAEGGGSTRLSRQWGRMEELKAIHDRSVNQPKADKQASAVTASPAVKASDKDQK